VDGGEDAYTPSQNGNKEVIDLPLKPYQREGVDFFHRVNGRGLNCDDMGTGKSLQTIAYIRESNNFPVIIVCPATVKSAWKSEFRKWLDMDVYTQEGEVDEPIPEDVNVVITSYNLLQYRHLSLSQVPGKLIVFDEAHTLQNPGAKMTKKAIQLSRRFPHVIGLSGTPMQNRPRDFWPILHIIRPQEYRVFTPFGHKYCDPQYHHFGWTFNGATNLEQLAEEVKPFIIRRTKAQVLGNELKKHTTYIVPLDIDDRESYDFASSDFSKWMTNVKKKPLNNKQKKAEKLLRVGELLRHAVRSKSRNLVKWIREYREQNPEKKVVIFCHHDRMMELLIRRLPVNGEEILSISGSTPSSKRGAIVARFQECPEIRVIICKIQSAGAGITLTAAQTTIYAELPWVPADYNQSRDRNYRIGQDENVDCYVTVAKDTIEHRLCEALQEKQKAHDVVIDGKKENESGLPLMDLLLKAMEREKDTRK